MRKTINTSADLKGDGMPPFLGSVPGGGDADLDLLNRAAKLSEALRAIAAPLCQVSWDIDAKAAMIRRHSNGPSPQHGGTADEQSDLRRAIEAGERQLAASDPDPDPDQLMLAEGTIIEILLQAATLLVQGGQIMRALTDYIPNPEVISEATNRAGNDWLDQISAFARVADMTFEVLGGDAKRQEAAKAAARALGL